MRKMHLRHSSTFAIPMRNVEQYYQVNIPAWEEKVATFKRLSLNVSNLRLLTALLMAGSVYAFFAFNANYGWISVALTALFIKLVRRSVNLEHDRQLAEMSLQLSRHELAFLRGDKNVFDAGTQFNPKNHLYALDLDIFGIGSLFQTVNRTVTFEGRHLLVSGLLAPPMDPDDIAKRKAAIKELSEAAEWREQFFSVGALSGEAPNDAEAMRAWIRQENFFKDKGHWLWIAGIMSLISTGLIVFMIATVSFYYLPTMGLIAVNTFLIQFIGKDIRQYFNRFGLRTKLYERFSELFALVAAREFSSPLCKSIGEDTKAASKAFLKLSQLSNLAGQRANAFVGPVMNGLFLFDIWTIRRIERWRIDNGTRAEGWVRALARMDMLNSLANFSFNHPSFCEAIVTPGNYSIVATAMGHPLLGVASVKNDYQIGVSTRAHIITGSNMAGKSTFIRAVGLNVILALNGLPVCAASFACPLLKIATCIRITDSLEDDTSYFKAELIRLKHIVDMLADKGKCLVLLDEILRGTNSDDKRNGTMAFFRKLKDYNSIALLATHDLAVGGLEKEDPAFFENFCFESSVSGRELHFDYKLHKGVSSSTNASFLMKQLGLID
jgi:hypothetical protein